ncbi:hypothetical protein C8R43DRAFT_966007 [Mycena crocata]|nr:hypothetical protein C8R43DRAFT_966007 [Mycena crocata]
MGSRGYVRLLVYMSGADRQSMEQRRAPSWPCEGWTDWGDASTDGMEGAKLAMRGMDGLGRRVDGWDGGRQVGHARYEGAQGWRTLDGYLFDSTRTTMFEETLPTYPSSDEHSRATHIHKILHITFLLGVAVLQDPGCGRVAQIARIPAISLCWVFSSFSASRRENTFALLRTILLGVPVPQGASATSDPHFPQESLGYVGMARIC